MSSVDFSDKLFRISQFANKNKGGPVEWMRFLLAQLPHRALQRSRHVRALNIVPVEMAHQLSCALIVDVPQGKQQGSCPSAEQASLKTQQFIAGSNEIHASSAAAQSHQSGIQFHLVQVIQIQVSVSEANPGKHGIVLAIHAVCGDVKQPTLRSLLSEQGRCGLFAQVEGGTGKQGAHAANFVQDLRRALIRDAKYERGWSITWSLLLAQRKNRRARSIGNREGVAKIFVPVFQGMERQEMKRAVRHKNQMISLKQHAQRRNQLAIERFQMALSSAQERLFESLHVAIAHAEFGNLKPQQLKKISHARKHGYRQNSRVVP